MLQHEPEEIANPNAANSHAAQARVTPEELNAALKALEDRQSSTVAIGTVVDELRLNATPEQIWEQVQQQRAQQAKAEQDERQSKVTVRVMVNGQAVAQSSAAARRRMRTWRDIKGWAWILFWCTGGLGLLALSPEVHNTVPVVANGTEATVINGKLTSFPYQAITINGDLEAQPINVQGKDVFINGDFNRITLHGQAQSVTVNGDFDTLNGDAPQSYTLNGDFDRIR